MPAVVLVGGAVFYYTPFQQFGISPNSQTVVEGLLKKAAELTSRGNSEAAIESYLQVLRVDPQNFQALVKLGEVYSATGNFSASTEAFEKAIAIDQRTQHHCSAAES